MEIQFNESFFLEHTMGYIKKNLRKIYGKDREDIMQECLLTALEFCNRYMHKQDKCKNFYLSIGYYSIMNVRKKIILANRKHEMIRTADRYGISPIRMPDNTSIKEELKSFIEKLKPIEQKIIKELLNNRKSGEIAETLNIKEEFVYCKKNELKKKFEKYFSLS